MTFLHMPGLLPLEGELPTGGHGATAGERLGYLTLNPFLLETASAYCSKSDITLMLAVLICTLLQ